MRTHARTRETHPSCLFTRVIKSQSQAAIERLDETEAEEEQEL